MCLLIVAQKRETDILQICALIFLYLKKILLVTPFCNIQVLLISQSLMFVSYSLIIISKII